jgi:hypothetical protein
MTLLEIVAIIFALFALSRVILRMKEKKLSVLEFLFWSVIWISLVFMAIFPDALTAIADRIGIQSGTGLVVYTAIIVLFYLIFRVYIKVDTLEQEITLLTRAVTLHHTTKTRQRSPGTQKSGSRK